MKRILFIKLLLTFVSIINAQDVSVANYSGEGQNVTKILNIIGDSYVKNHKRPVEEATPEDMAAIADFKRMVKNYLMIDRKLAK